MPPSETLTAHFFVQTSWPDTAVDNHVYSHSLCADWRHRYDAVQVRSHPVDEAPHEVLRGVYEVRAGGHCILAHLGGHHMHLILPRPGVYHMGETEDPDPSYSARCVADLHSVVLAELLCYLLVNPALRG